MLHLVIYRLETLTKDVNQAPPKQNQDNVCFEGGDFCLALYEEKQVY